MPRYRVTTTVESIQVVTADNPFQAAVQVGGNVTDVRPATGRPPASSVKKATSSKKIAKKVAKKRRPMSAETRAKLAKNLVKARAAKAKKAKAVKKTTRKSTR